MDGHIYAFVTCTRVKREATVERGWIDTGWNRYTLHDSRNDVRPIAEGTYQDLDYLTDDVRDAFKWLGAHEDNGDGTFYASDSDEPFDQEWSYSYALHFVRKFDGPKGWTEEAWIPPASMRYVV